MRVKTSVEMFSLRLPIARGVGLKLWVFLCLDDILEDVIVAVMMVFCMVFTL